MNYPLCCLWVEAKTQRKPLAEKELSSWLGWEMLADQMTRLRYSQLVRTSPNQTRNLQVLRRERLEDQALSTLRRVGMYYLQP